MQNPPGKFLPRGLTWLHKKPTKLAFLIVTTFTLGACGGSGGSNNSEDSGGTTNLPENNAPQVLSASTIAVAENQSNGIYQVAAQDDDNDPITTSLGSGGDSALFGLNTDGLLSFINPPNFEVPADLGADNIYQIFIHVDDGTDETIFELNVEVTNINEPPKLDSVIEINIDEGQSGEIFNVQASDEEEDTLLYSISNSGDATNFTISSEGTLDISTAADFETPLDLNADNTYILQVEISDGINTVETTISVSIQNIIEGIVFSSEDSISIPENLDGLVYQAAAANLDYPSEEVTYTLNPTEDATLFSLDGTTGELSLTQDLDFESPEDQDGDNTYNLLISADSESSEASQLALYVNIENQDQLDIEVHFPPPNSNLVGASNTIHVSGSLRDLEDGIVGVDDIEMLTVNGVQAEVIDGRPDRWSVQVPIEEKSLEIIAEITSNSGTDTAEFSIQNDPQIKGKQLVFDAQNNRVLYFNKNVGGIVAVDMANGERNIFSNRWTAEGPMFIDNTIAERLILDEENNRLIVYDASSSCCSATDSFMTINLETGNRALLIQGEYWGYERSAAIDIANDRAFLLGQDGVAQLDLLTGELIHVSGGDVGDGPSFGFASVISWDSVNELLLVADHRIDNENIGILEIDIDTGNRRVLSGGFFGSGAAFDRNILDMVFDPSGAEVYALTSSSIYSVNSTTGSRSILGGPLNLKNSLLDNAFDIDFSSSTVAFIDNTNGSLLTRSLSGEEQTVVSKSALGLGPVFIRPTELLESFDDTSFLVADPDSRAIYTVDPSTGNRVEISGPNIGDGPEFSPQSFVIDSENNRLIVLDRGARAVFTVDSLTGDRNIVSSTDIGAGPDFSNVTSIAYISSTDKAYVHDNFLDRIFEVDVVSGDREILISFNPDDEPLENTLQTISAASDGENLLLSDQSSIFELDPNSLERNNLWAFSSFFARDFDFNSEINGILFTRGSLKFIDLNFNSVTTITGYDNEGNRIGVGPTFSANSLVPDWEAETSYVLNDDANNRNTGIFIVDHLSGDRVFVSF